MQKIKLIGQTATREKAWEALLDKGSVHRVSTEEIYLVSEKQMKYLEELRLPFERLDGAKSCQKV